MKLHVDIPTLCEFSRRAFIDSKFFEQTCLGELNLETIRAVPSLDKDGKFIGVTVEVDQVLDSEEPLEKKP